MACELATLFGLHDCTGEKLTVSQLTSPVQSRLLSFGDGVFTKEHVVCDAHATFFSQYPKTTCCDPYKKHKKITRAQKNMNANDFLAGCQGNLAVWFKDVFTPSSGFCRHCYDVLQVQVKDTVQEENLCPTETECLKKLNDVLQLLSMEPVSFGRRNKIGKAALIKETISSISDELLHLFDLPNVEQEKEQKFDKVVARVNSKLDEVSHQEGISLLTLFSGILKQQEIMDTFQFSKRAAMKASFLLKTEGILAEPPAKRGRKTDDYIVDLIWEFYLSEDNSRILPNAKDVMEVFDIHGNSRKLSKRILLMSTTELHAKFKQEHPEVEIGITKFREYRPACCILLGDAKKEVCVCVYHSNLEFLYEAIGVQDYVQFLSLLVCNMNSKDCMYRRCKECTDKSDTFTQAVKTHISSKKPQFEAAGVKYKQWCENDRSTQALCHLNLTDFVEYLYTTSVSTLKHHHVSQVQAEYFRISKENVTEDSAVIQCDFSENYSTNYAVETQAFHFNKQQTTLHPLMLYTKKDGEPIKRSIVIVSDELSHITNAYFAFQKRAVEWIKSEFPGIKNIKYFTDGAAAHYKNKKNFVNILHHFKDNGIHATHHFYASCHGKGACDGVGGTVKAAAKRASIAGALINTPVEFHEFVEKQVHVSKSIFVSKEEIDNLVSEYNLEARYSSIQKVPQLRQVHKIQPLEDSSSLELFELSTDTEPSAIVKTNTEDLEFRPEDLQKGDWVAAFYDELWYLGVVKEIFVDQEEILAHFLKGKGSSSLTFRSFERGPIHVTWRQIICKIQPPTISNRIWSFPQSVHDMVEKYISNQ